MASRTSLIQSRSIYVGTSNSVAPSDGNLIVIGNVGIGTTSPNERLSVNGNIESYDTFILNYGSNGNKWQQLFDGANSWNLRYYNGSSWSGSAITVNTSNNVGIGTTSPESKLHVAGGDVLISNGQYYTAESTTGGNYKLAGLTAGNVIVVGAIDYTSAGTIFAGGDNVNITTGGVAGSSRIYINSSGNVGIGTTSPSQLLHVYKTSGHHYGLFENTIYETGVRLKNSQADWTIFIDDSSNNNNPANGIGFWDNTANANRLVIDGSGNVGIGTASPTGKLDVRKAQSTTAFTSPFLKLYPSTTTNTTGLTSITLGTSTIDNYGVSLSGWRHATDGDPKFTIKMHYNSATGSDALTIDSSGNVGIGTTSPAAKLTVTGAGALNGEVRIDAASNNTLFGIYRITGDASTYEKYLIGYNSAHTSQANELSLKNTGGDITLYTGTAGGASEKVRITSAGNVGIGTTSPSTNLHVAGSVRVTGDRIDVNSNTRITGAYYENSNTEYTYIDMYNGGNASINIGTKHPLSYISFESGSGAYTERMRITNTGNVGIGTTSPSAKLHVYNGEAIIATSTDGIKLSYSVGNSSGIIDTAFSDNNLEFRTNGSTKMWIANGGNVGIGTTSPNDELHVEGVIQSKKQLLPSTSGTAGWYKIGTLEDFVQGGSTAVIEIAGHQGYNASNSQDYLIKLFIKTSNGNAGGPNGQGYNSWYERTGGNSALIEFKWDNSATNDYDLYMYIPIHSLRSYYSVTKGTGTWVNAGTSATDPGANSASVLKATGLFNILDTNVGIGTTNPTSKLHVEYAGGAPNGLLVKATTNRSKLIVSDNDTSAYVIAENSYASYGMNDSLSANNININISGNVGIGTTSPGVKLQVGSNTDTSNYTRVLTATADLYLGSNPSSTHIGVTNGAKILQTASYPLVIGTTQNQELHLGANNAIIATLVSGNVGIGTTSPSFKLDVNGDIRATQLLLNESFKGGYNSYTQGAMGQFVIQSGLGGLGEGGSADHLLFRAPDLYEAATTSGGAYSDVTSTYSATYKNLFTGLANNVSITNQSVYSIRMTWDNIGYKWFDTLYMPCNLQGNTIDIIIEKYNGTTWTIVATRNGFTGWEGRNVYINSWNNSGHSDKLRITFNINWNNSNAANIYRIAYYGGYPAGAENKLFTWDYDKKINIYGDLKMNGGTFLTDDGVSHYVMSQSNLYLYSGSSNTMTLSNSGRVGIGTTSPSAKLHVLGSATSTDSAMRVANSSNSPLLQVRNDGHIAINHSDFDYTLDVMKFANNNDDTIINIRSNWANTSTGKRIGSLFFSAKDIDVDSGAYKTAAAVRVFAENEWTASSDSNAYISFDVLDSGTLSSKMYIKSDGNVGIGTGSPIHKLYVNGDIGLSDGYRIWLRGSSSSSATGAQSYIYSDGLNLKIKGDDNVQLLGDGGGVILHADYTGNVGINTTSPGAKLDVVGDVRVQYANSSTTLSSGGSMLRLANSDTTADNISAIDFPQSSAGSGFSRIGVVYKDRTASSEDQDMFFRTIGGGSSAEVMRLTSAGNVGIGTTSPSYKLDVATGNDNAIRILNSLGGNNNGLALSVGSGTPWLDFYGGRFDIKYNSSPGIWNSGANIFLSILSSGNVGVGTTSPSYKLQVNGSIWARPTSDGTSGTAIHMGRFTDTDTPAYSFITDDYNGDTLYVYSHRWGIDYKIQRASSSGTKDVLRITGEDTNGHFAMLYNASNTVAIKLSTNSDSYLNGGNVGIGTTSPDSKFHVEDTNPEVRITGTGGTSFPRLLWEYPVTATQASRWALTGGASANIFYLYNYTQSKKVFQVDGTASHITLNHDAAGTTQIGTSTTQTAYQLYVKTNVGQTGAIEASGAVKITSGALGVNIAASATAGRIDASNDIVAYSTSDQRLKENIKPLENATEKVKQLTGVEFDWKQEHKAVHGYEGHDVGVIAQEVQEVLPEAIRTNDSGYLSVRYEKLIALLVESNKELAARVELLEQKLKQ